MINIAQIGVGYWGPNLLRNLTSNPKCNVKTVVELSKERQSFVRSLYPDIYISDNINSILSDESINAVVIATPVATHFDISMRVLKSGKHVLIEKPMATKSKEITQIGQLAKKNKLVAMVGHTFLFNSAVRFIKELITEGELGDIRYIYSQRLNLGRIRNDVDALWNLAPHDISIIQYWLDEPSHKSIKKIGMDYVQKGIDDVAFMNIIYPNNIMAHVHVSWLDPHKIRKMTVVGSKKMIVYDDIAEDKVIIYDKGIDRMAILGEQMDFDDPTTFLFNHRSGEVNIPVIEWVEPLKTEIDHFLDCIVNKIPCLTGYDHAKKVVSILEEATN
jgi:predicted dehydrogenase